MCEIMFEHFKV
jgi:actin